MFVSCIRSVLTILSGWSTWKATALASGIGALFTGIQVVLILTLRVSLLQFRPWNYIKSS